ncbi:FAD dependent oxidoreductase [Apiospora marii]|uniref:FAD dependent oxidoreductase n=1 Tax=Apiospora marii TaxID=335849 RepID=A0ABR1QZR7_9PEZI
MLDKDAPILIIGAGTFGLSTAYHFARAGHSNITVLEKSGAVPPADSAGNDLNKIVRAEYEDPFYAELALEAMAAWKTDPLFSPHYHETGYLLANSAAAPDKAKKTLRKSLASIQQHPAFRGKISPIVTREDITKVAPVFDGPMQWKGYFNRFAGYAHAADALTAVYSACCALGVAFRTGDAVASLTYATNPAGEARRCTGAVTAAGKRYTAALTVLALGAALATVLPEVGRQVAANAWAVAHIQLTPEEAQRLRGIPVTYARDLGFFFEPDRRTNLLKLCPSGAGYTNFVSSSSDGKKSVSVPPDFNDFITPADEEKVRKLLRETLPGLAERPLVNKHLCWCADTADSEYIVDFVPGTGGRSLIVASGDSGHAFKMLPVAGRWVVELAKAGAQEKGRWRWKAGQDAGGDVSWRIGRPVDLGEVPLGVRSKL